MSTPSVIFIACFRVNFSLLCSQYRSAFSDVGADLFVVVSYRLCRLHTFAYIYTYYFFWIICIYIFRNIQYVRVITPRRTRSPAFE